MLWKDIVTNAKIKLRTIVGIIEQSFPKDVFIPHHQGVIDFKRIASTACSIDVVVGHSWTKLNGVIADVAGRNEVLWHVWHGCFYRPCTPYGSTFIVSSKSWRTNS